MLSYATFLRPDLAIRWRRSIDVDTNCQETFVKRLPALLVEM
jgi:hypothetical protein